MIAYVVQVLALGMIFIGVTMTLIAHWPGSTSIGENPLKVAGPVLLSVGVVALIIGIVLVGVVNTRERRRWQKQMARMIISRSCVLQSSLSLSLSLSLYLLCLVHAILKTSSSLFVVDIVSLSNGAISAAI